MPKLEYYENTYYEFTGKLSTINRQAAFAGIGIIWLFKIQDGTSISIDPELITPAFYLFIGLALDMLQYIYQAAAWSIFYIFHNNIKEAGPDEEINNGAFINTLAWIIYVPKVLAVSIAYISIGCFLYDKFIS